MLNIAVAGATGTVGKYVTELAKDAGFNVAKLCRAKGVDLLKPETIDLAGIDVVIDVTSGGGATEESQIAFFESTTKNLGLAEEEAGVAHHVLLLIVGIERLPHGHYAAKLAQEEAVKNIATPHTILRATQFFEFAIQNALRTLQAGVAQVPEMRSQPLAAREVAMKLVEVAEETPHERAQDVAGPKEENIATLARKIFERRKENVLVEEVTVSGPFGEGIKNGLVLPDENAWLSSLSFDEWLNTPDALG